MTGTSFRADPGRLDAVVADHLRIARADAQRAIEAGRVLVDGRPRRKSHKLVGGETIIADPAGPTDIAADPNPIRIVFEDPHLAVVSKPAGVLSHPAASNRTGTLLNRLIGMGMPLAGGGGPDRPGLVHRLDAGTSGLMVVAKEDAAHKAMVDLFRRHEVLRIYLALVRGTPSTKEFLIDAPLRRMGARIRVDAGAARKASTEVSVRQEFERAALVEARPLTGRTHQIRVHLSAVGHPILGDRAYGGGGDDARRLELTRPFLHSWRIGFDHPVTGERIMLEDPLPEDLEMALLRVRNAPK